MGKRKSIHTYLLICVCKHSGKTTQKKLIEVVIAREEGVWADGGKDFTGYSL